jgi:Fe2+ transport system protein FeoA
MMELMGRLRESLFGGAGWKDACEAGAPVAVPGGCPGLDCHSVRLTGLGPGDRASVSCLEEPWTGDAARLAGLGILPGVRLSVLQRYPGYILQLGRTQIAIDHALARRVRVRISDPIDQDAAGS